MRRLLIHVGLSGMIVLPAVWAAYAQIAAAPPYVLQQSVVSGGGEKSTSAGNTYSVTGAVGQAVAGSSSGAANYLHRSGFYVFGLAAPTASSVSISGRVVMDSGRGITNARVVLEGPGLAAPMVAATGRNGAFTFSDVPAGQTYLITVQSRRYFFSQPSQIVSVVDTIGDLVFTGTSAGR
jgi:hypothetical protein